MKEYDSEENDFIAYNRFMVRQISQQTNQPNSWNRDTQIHGNNSYANLPNTQGNFYPQLL